MKRILLILITLSTSQLFACLCGEINEEYIEKLKQEVDYIFIGTVVENINLNNSEISDYLWKKNNSANEVILKVEKVIKGKLKPEYIYLNQFNAGNCSRSFKKGEKYVISGFKISGFINLNPQKRNKLIENKSAKNESFKIYKVPIDQIKKPEIEFKENVFYAKNIEYDYKNWNELSKRKTVILTSACISGTLKSNFGKLITKGN